MLKINPGIVFGGGGGGEWEKGAGTRNIVWSVFPCPASPPLLHLPPAFCSLLSLRGLGVGEDHLLSPRSPREENRPLQSCCLPWLGCGLADEVQAGGPHRAYS